MSEQIGEVPVKTDNEYALYMSENLPNHSASLKGRAKFISQGRTSHPLFRTRQEAYRYAAWLISMAEILPDEEGAHSFEVVLNAVRNT